MPDYEAEDLALDDEIRGLYASDEDEALDESSTAESDEETATEPDNGTPEPVNDAVEEETVPKFRYDEAVRAMNKAQADLAYFRKQGDERDAVIDDLQRQISELKAAKQAPPVEDENDLDNLRGEYPEIANPLLRVIDDLKRQLAEVKGEVSGVKSVSDRYQQSEAKTAQQQWREAVRSKHADIDDLEKSQEFWGWVNSQPPIIKYALDQGTPDDAIAALNLYRAEKPSAAVPDTKVDKLSAAKAVASPNVKSGGKPEQKQTFTNAQIAKMSRDEFMKHEAAIDEAMARGEIT